MSSRDRYNDSLCSHNRIRDKCSHSKRLPVAKQISVPSCSFYACRLISSLFLPRSAMLARYMLSSCVCPSVTSRYCIETTGRIELVLAQWLPSIAIPHCVVRNFGISKIRVLLSLELCPPNFELRKFRRSKSIVLSTKLVDGQRCLTTRPTRRVVAVYYTSVNSNYLTL